MPVTKDYSIAADSTADVNSASNSPLIKRAKRTYGRVSRPVEDSPGDISCDTSSTQFSHYNTATPGLSEEVPPSSDPFEIPGDDQDEEDAQPSPTDDTSAFEFSWNKNMKLLDKDLTTAIPEELPSAPAFEFAWKKNLKLLDEEMDEDDAPAPTLPTTSPHPVTKDDIFNESFPTLPSSSPFKPPSPATRASHSKTRQILDSEDEGDSQETNPSPAHPHPIRTPNAKSSPTPPSSIGEDSDNEKPKPPGKKAVTGRKSLSMDEDMGEKVATSSSKRPPPKRSSKLKKPTKKELQATIIDGARITAAQQVPLVQFAREQVQVQAAQNKYSLSSFFQAMSSKTQPLAKAPSSDPIIPFSSPSHEHDTSRMEDVPEHPQSSRDIPTSPVKPITKVHFPAKDVAKDGHNSDSDEDLPDVDTLLKETTTQKEDVDRRKKLAQTKAAALRAQAVHVASDGDDDDLVVEDADMHAVADEEAEERRRAKGKGIMKSEGRKRQMVLAKVPVGVQSAKKERRSPGKVGSKREEMIKHARSSFGAVPDKGKGKGKAWGKDDLNKILLKEVAETNTEETRRKEEEWVRRGGRIGADGERLGQVVSLEAALEVVAGKGLAVAKKRMEDDEQEESDEEWEPGMVEEKEYGSGDEEEEEEGEDADMEDAQDAGDQEEQGDENEEPSLPLPRARPRPRHSAARAVVDSDDEESPNENNAPMGPPLLTARGRSLSSFDTDGDGDETDKENSANLMYDKGDDKENRAVVRHSSSLAPRPLGARMASIGGLSDVLRAVSMSPSGYEFSDDENENRGSAKGRSSAKRPLGEWPPQGDDDVFASPLRAGLSPSNSSSFVARLQQHSPLSLRPDPPLQETQQFKPLSFPSQLSASGFSDDENDAENKPTLKPAPALLGGFGSGSFDNWETDENGAGSALRSSRSMLDKLRKPDDLSLSLDVRLQPAVQLDEDRQRQALAVFEKEQEYLLDAANQKPKNRPQKEMYVNDHGFLTQTRPEEGTPEIYRVMSPSQPNRPSSRAPLRTLSMSMERASSSDEEGTPTRTRTPLSERDPTQNSPLRRLRKRTGNSPAPLKLNAFEMMERQHQKALARFTTSDFVEDQAQESDEDDMFGFGGQKPPKADDEDGEDLDRNDEGLVDDAVMDEETLGEQLVLEKVREHEVEDDKNLEKMHLDATTGKWRSRKGKRGLLDVNLSSDEEEDNLEDKWRRSRMLKKRRRLEGDGFGLDAIRKNPKHSAFINLYDDMYQVDDGDEFAHLRGGEDVDMADSQEPEEDLTVEEVKRRLLAVARGEEEVETLGHDPYDVSWVDEQDEEMGTRVKVPRATLPSVVADVEFEDIKQLSKNVPKDADKERFEKWGKSERRNVNTGGTGRAAAVTGHSAKAGGGSLRGARSVSGGSAVAEAGARRRVSAVKRTGSMLAKLSDRSGLFES